MKHPLKAAVMAGVAVSALTLSTAAGSAAPLKEVVVADPDAPVTYEGTISVLTKFGLEQLSPFFVDLAKKYEELHPGVTVELDQESDDSVKGKTKTLVASNSLPDIYFTWTGNWGHNFVRGNRAVDLTKVIGPGTEWGETFAPAAVKSFIYNDKYFGIPLYLDAKFMGYNKAMFEKAGIDKPETFDELISACDALKETGVTPISLGNKEAWPVVHYVGQLLAYNVPQATLEKDFDPEQAEYAHPGYVKALKEFKEIEEHCTDGASMNGTSYASALQAFSNAQSAMYYQEILEFDQSATEDSPLKVEDFGFFQLPAPADAEGDPKAIEGAPEGYMINARSSNIPLAIDFMKFVTSPENAKIVSAPPYGQPTAVKGVVNEEVSSPTVVEGMQDIAEASYLMPWLDTANTPHVAAAWLTSLQALAGDTMTPEEVVEKVREAAKAEARR
ncbi:extracellular solute-binding protein [Afifella sp. JA880]|uniref:ABC transporter substrate-binding protein n=1 Tax=Afifella sp. JA880 TaxID=2975280 RepID=UPI0021BB5162|nr:extracellular solute-binding protein [Afifella sp. JA880]MCT8268287.1 extracellular solute-binding protein [Afifella sp. JA880]